MRYAASAEMATACKVDENLHRWWQFRYSLILCVLCPVAVTNPIWAELMLFMMTQVIYMGPTEFSHLLSQSILSF